MRRHYPEGRQLPALERNILKFRAFEMVIFLFHAESLKEFVLETVRATSRERIPAGTKKPIEKAFAFLVEDGTLTERESAAIRQLIDFRNEIGHRVHEVTADLSRDRGAQDLVEFGGSRYLPGALDSIIRYELLIHARAAHKYIVPLSFDHLVFEAAEKVYRRELTRLEKTIHQQLGIRKRQIAELNREIEAADARSLDEIGPYHPLNIARNGTMTERGNTACFQLFALDLSDLAVAHLMRTSLRAIKAKRRIWQVPGV